MNAESNPPQDVTTAVAVALHDVITPERLDFVIDALVTALVVSPSRFGTHHPSLTQNHPFSFPGFTTSMVVARALEIHTSQVVSGAIAAGSIDVFAAQHISLSPNKERLSERLHEAAQGGSQELSKALQRVLPVVKTTLSRTGMMVQLLNATDD